MSFGFVPLPLKSGPTAAEVQALIGTALNAQDGKTGWVSGGVVNLAGNNFVDLVGIPVEANAVQISLQGISTTGTSSMYVQVFNASQTLVTASAYYGYLNNLAGTAVTSFSQNPGNACIVAGSLLAANFVTGDVELTRHIETSFLVKSMIFDGLNRKMDAGHVTPSVGTGITGVRLFLGTAGVNWDAGQAVMRWRK
ncbi:hypothetical protein [Neorhizobium tomejilense]|uniref:hypothetical protein n=1 Tax=Neorhizobium tomejilense TaxID=2093828 RepID=UPI003ECE9A45